MRKIEQNYLFARFEWNFLLFRFLENFASRIRSFFSSFFLASSEFSSCVRFVLSCSNFSLCEAKELRRCCWMAAKGFSLKDGWSKTKPMCEISTFARTSFDLLVLHGGAWGKSTEELCMESVEEFPGRRFGFDDGKASRMESRPSSFPFCSSKRRSRSDDMTIFSRFRYCSLLARRFLCPRLSDSLPSFKGVSTAAASFDAELFRDDVRGDVDFDAFAAARNFPTRLTFGMSRLQGRWNQN